MHRAWLFTKIEGKKFKDFLLAPAGTSVVIHKEAIVFVLVLRRVIH